MLSVKSKFFDKIDTNDNDSLVMMTDFHCRHFVNKVHPKSED